MIDRNVEQINELARRIFEKKLMGSNPYLTYEFDKFFPVLQKWSIRFARRLNFKDEDIIHSAFHDAIMNSLKVYDGVRDFLPLFEVAYRRQLLSELRKDKSKKNDVVSLDDEKYYNTDNDLQNIGLASNISSQVENQDTINNFLLSIAVFVKKKNSNKIPYYSIFFTNGLVYAVFAIGDWFDQTIQCNSNKFDEAVVNVFMNSLLTGECSSVTEIKKFEIRLLSEFTEKESDADKACCNDLYPEYCVVNCFLKKYYKAISQSAFSQQKGKYSNMLKNIAKDIGFVD